MTAVAEAPTTEPARVRVQVWFGTYLISDWTGPAAFGHRLAEKHRQTFSNKCTVTAEPIRTQVGAA